MPKLPDSGFDRVAPFYDALAWLVYGNTLRKAQLYLLQFIPNQSRVLVIGGGSGWLLQQLILLGKQLDILYLEAAPGMLALAREKYNRLPASHGSKADFRLGTEVAIHSDEQFDVIITPFLLDLFPPQRLHLLMQKLSDVLASGGKWLFTDFCPVQQPPRWWQNALVWSMYTFFGKLSGVKAKKLPDYGKHFTKLGFQEILSQSFYSGFVQSKVFSRK